MKLKLVLVAGLLSQVVSTAVLGYGVSYGCGYCGPAIAGLWGVVLLGNSPLARENEAEHAAWRELVEVFNVFIESE